MATYKVIQDIEAEDKLLGPLSLRQFLYASISVVALYISYFFFSHGLVFAVVLPLPIAILSGFFAFPWGRDQPTEVWALAKVRFMFKPHKRIWDQTGTKELVTVTAPKKIAANFAKDLSPQEVESRLKALAETIDTRGWVTKNVNVNLFSPANTTQGLPVSDRLISTENIVPDIPDVDIRADEDILDENNNPTAQHFEQMIAQKEKEHHEKLVEKTKNAVSGKKDGKTSNDFWFLNQSDQPDKASNGYATFGSRIVVPQDDSTPSKTMSIDAPTEEDIIGRPIVDPLNETSPEAAYPSYTKVIKPPSDDNDNPIPESQSTQAGVISIPIPSNLSAAPSDSDTATKGQPDETTPQNPPEAAMTPPLSPAIINLASNNDRNVASIAREANANNVDQLEKSNDEVIITLH